MSSFKAFISGCAGLSLTDEERSFFRDEKPCGLILFQRNCDNKDQLKALIAEYKEAVAFETPLVLIDQEGGRVARLKPPHWRRYPPARAYEKLFMADANKACEASEDMARVMSQELNELGINMNCTPVLDIPQPGAHEIIGDRAFSSDIETIITLARAQCTGLLSAGIIPVIKHIPGHGRAAADSHEKLPIVDVEVKLLEQTDFAPFKALNKMPAAMTGHLLFPQLDARHPVSTSSIIIRQIIRDYIGFDGLLMSDDLSMKALCGNMAERTQAVLSAGCDLALHCNGNMDEMRAVAQNSPVLTGAGAARLASVQNLIKMAQNTENQLNSQQAEARYQHLQQWFAD